MSTAISSDLTAVAISEQLAAMHSEVYEVGIFNHAKTAMDIRTWDAERIHRSMNWLKFQNVSGCSIYIRPHGEHQYSLVDDLTRDAIAKMKRDGIAPAVVVETSPNNFQAWVKHGRVLTAEHSTHAAQHLAREYGADVKAAAWRQFGRLAGFTNRKEKYLDAATGRYPFVRLRESWGQVYEAAPRLLASIERMVLDEHRRQAAFTRQLQTTPRQYAEQKLKTIDDFRNDQRYGGDFSRIDIAYAKYALNRGVSQLEVAAAIQSRDLRKKGGPEQQRRYVERTMRKAMTNTTPAVHKPLSY